MKLLLALAAIAVLGATPVHEPKVWLMYFTKGKPGPTDEAEGKKLMEGHFANMNKQVDKGLMFAAGPLRDPTGHRRGITIVAAHDRPGVDALFVDDPFVKAGIMGVEAAEWKVPSSRFNPKVDSKKLAQFSLVLVGRGKGMQPENEEMQRAHAKALESLVAHFGPAVVGQVEGMGKVREAAIVTGQDEEKIRAVFAHDPLVQKAILEIEIVPLFMTEGVVRSGHH